MKSLLIYIAVNIIAYPLYITIQGLSMWAIGMTEKKESILATIADNLLTLSLSFIILLIPNLLTFLIIRWKFKLKFKYNTFFFVLFSVLLFSFYFVRILPSLN